MLMMRSSAGPSFTHGPSDADDAWSFRARNLDYAKAG